MASSNHELWGGTPSGDGRALRELLAESGPVVRRRLAGKIPPCWRSVLALDDLMQQTYTDAFLTIDRFVPQGEGSFTAWLTKLARCNLSDALRMLRAEKRGYKWRRIVSGAGEGSWAARYEWLEATRTTPSRHVAQEEACAALEWALQQLPEEYRQVVRMYDLEDRPAEEVAKALRRSAGAVYVMRGRAHRKLRELLGSASKYFSTG